jgi:hypothetical protein
MKAHLVFLTTVACLAVVPAVRAQTVGDVNSPAASPIADSAATIHVAVASSIDAPPAAVHRTRAPLTLDAALAPTRQNMGQAKALMIVGGVGFLAGAVIGGDAGTIVMLGSAVVGLYGLYQYLQ